MTRPGAPLLGAPSSWLPAAAAPLVSSRATSAPRCSRVVAPPSVTRYPVVVQTYSPGVKVVRQASSPNLSPAAMVVPAAQSPGLVVKHRGSICAPLPTWAAPATPPRAGMTAVVKTTAPEKESAPGAPGAPGAPVPGTAAPSKPTGPGAGPGAAPRGSRKGVDEDALRARLEVTRRELTEKMSELRELEASLLSTSFTKRFSDHTLTRPFDVLVEESETTGQSSGTPSPDSQTFFKCSTKAVATDTDDLLCTEPGPGLSGPSGPSGPPVQDALTAPEGQQLEQSATSTSDTGGKVEPAEMAEIAVPPVPVATPEGRESQDNGTTGDGKVKIDLTSKADSSTDSKAEKVQVKRDRSTSVPKRVQILPPRPSSISAPTASSPPARSRTSSVKERPRMATQLHIPVSARLSSRRARNANTGMEKSFSARELSRPLPSNSTASASATSVTSGTLEVADVARLVASPEIGTLDDFLPNPVPEPEVLSGHSVAMAEVNGKSEVAKGPCKDAPASNPERRRSVPGSPRRGTVREAQEETARTGSRMLWSQQLTALSCSELPRRSPSPQRMPRAVPKTPLRGSTAQLRVPGSAGTEAGSDVPSRSQKKQVTWKARSRPSEARESGRKETGSQLRVKSLPRKNFAKLTSE